VVTEQHGREAAVAAEATAREQSQAALLQQLRAEQHEALVRKQEEELAALRELRVFVEHKLQDEEQKRGVAQKELERSLSERMVAQQQQLQDVQVAPHPGGCSGQRACPHAQLGIPETAHGPTLEYHQLPYGSSTHSLTPLPHSLTHSLTHSLHSLTPSLPHSLTPLTHSLTHSLTRSLTRSLAAGPRGVQAARGDPRHGGRARGARREGATAVQS
jgi:exonuclease VII large subunit